MRRYFEDAAVLARKDLRLELRARDTLPAMLLFVLSILVVFHFALPDGSSRLAELGLLWVAILFTALLGLGRAFVAEREQGLLDGLVLAPVDRSAIWLGEGYRHASLSSPPPRWSRCPPSRSSSSRSAWSTVAGVVLANVGICAVGTLLAAMAAAGRARELLLPLLFLPLALPIVIGGRRRERRRRLWPLPRFPRALRRDLRAARLGVVRVRRHGVTGTAASCRASRRCSRASGHMAIERAEQEDEAGEPDQVDERVDEHLQVRPSRRR